MELVLWQALLQKTTFVQVPLSFIFDFSKNYVWALFFSRFGVDLGFHKNHIVQ